MKLFSAVCVACSAQLRKFNEDCPSLSQSELCENNCQSENLSCIGSCGQDPNCVADCTREYAACSDLCPCYGQCFDGCPCEFDSSYCQA